MKKISHFLIILPLIFGTGLFISCNEDPEDTKECTGCSDDSPYSAIGSDTCYTTESECNDNESGNCVICQ